MASLVPQGYYDAILANYGIGPLTRGTQAGFLPGGGYRGDGTEVRGHGPGESRERMTPMSHPGEFALDMLSAPARAVTNMAVGLGSSIADAAMLPGDVVTGKIDPRSEEGMRRAVDFGGTVMTGGLGLGIMGGAPRGALGMSGGRLAKTADQTAGPQMSAPAQPKGITAYHGSPHDFDRFDMSKIGTGEGAQAYGHGLYFSESPKVARAYEGMLAGNGYDPAVIARDALFDSGGDAAKALAALQKATPPKIGLPELDVLTDNYGIAKQHIQAYIAGTPLPLPHKGRMYQVRINAEPEQFLDWDKPVNQQSENVRKAFAIGGTEVPNKIGREAYYELAADMPKDKVGEALRDSGIPGIRYLDQGSRDAGEGSRNYVVFDDKIVDILKKYGIAAAASMYGWDAVNRATGGQSSAQAAPAPADARPRSIVDLRMGSAAFGAPYY